MLITLLSFLVLFYFAEFIFSFIPYCEGVSNSYTSRLWLHYYWSKNKDGFRDVDFTQLELKKKKRIYFIGDSFTEGHGIKNMKDRTSDVIREKTEKYNYNIFNLGKCGSNTLDEIDTLFSRPFLPDIVVLTHINNDVDYLYDKYKIKETFFNNFKESNLLKKGSTFQKISEYSFFINFLYLFINQTYLKYSFQKIISQKLIVQAKIKKNIILTEKDISGNSENFKLFMKSYNGFENNKEFNITKQDQIFKNPDAFNEHINTICKLDSTLKSKSVKLIILLYPELNEFTINYSSINKKLTDALQAKNINAIDLTPLCSRLPESKRIVNSMNNHPSEQLCKIVADTLMTRLIPLL